jgi:hypothetical protein
MAIWRRNCQLDLGVIRWDLEVETQESACVDGCATLHAWPGPVSLAGRASSPCTRVTEATTPGCPVVAVPLVADG